MPGKDGTGPVSSGRKGMGRIGGQNAAGPGGECVCPSCNTVVPHVSGQSCNQINCPKCGTVMVRK